MTHECDVAIVGAGIGGLTLAASLLQQSISVRVFEQDTELREIGAGIAIAGNASRLLRRLSINLTDVANEPPAFEVRSWLDGGLLWSHPIGEWYRQAVGAPLLTLHRVTLQRLLAAAVPQDHISLGHRLVRLSDEPAGVRLHFGNGDDLVARIVVGADGVQSTARRYVCGEVAPRHSGEIGFRGIIRAGKVPDLPDPGSLHIWCGPGTHAVYYGLDGGTTINLLAVYTPLRLPDWTRSSNRAPATPDQALAIFAAYSWDRRILDLIRNIEGDMSFWALADLPPVCRWSRGRVVLLGDASARSPSASGPRRRPGDRRRIRPRRACRRGRAEGVRPAFRDLRKSPQAPGPAGPGLFTGRRAGLQTHGRCGGKTRCELGVAAAANRLDSPVQRGRAGKPRISGRLVLNVVCLVRHSRLRSYLCDGTPGTRTGSGSSQWNAS